MMRSSLKFLPICAMSSGAILKLLLDTLGFPPHITDSSLLAHRKRFTRHILASFHFPLLSICLQLVTVRAMGRKSRNPAIRDCRDSTTISHG
ncbi:hypothetical protein CC86DRAFT_118451 [Ophiobolus disseminans]|uniref:Uncharacterized protein n=1 Tax=Ophiobolus disseminans TaxID=1469910 RepID=A0A6A6ZIS4_9PLEO|nr:hypothetical protein CC86DRAFT_118451 [Ophiobolus disseminans]